MEWMAHDNKQCRRTWAEEPCDALRGARIKVQLNGRLHPEILNEDTEPSQIEMQNYTLTADHVCGLPRRCLRTG